MKYSFLISLFILCMVSTLPAQTPKQSYFEWTSMPFSKEELAERRAGLIHLLKEQGKSGLVVFPARDGFSSGETFRQLNDFYYFTGLELPNSLFVLNLQNESTVVYVPDTDARFYSATRPNDFPGMDLLSDSEIAEKSGLELKSLALFDTLMSKSAEMGQIIFINNGRSGLVTLPSDDYVASPSPEQILLLALRARHPGLNYINCYDEVAQLRMIKSPAEIVKMKKSIEITIEGIRTAAKEIQPGVTERYLEGVLEGTYKKNGSSRLAFGSIIKSGPNSLWPWRILATHYDRRNRAMESGDLVIFDVGCEFEYYISDMGRTFPVSGKFTKRQAEILEMETSISDQIIAFLKPGITFQDVKELTDRIIPEDAKKYMQVGLYFGHHIGMEAGDPSLTNVPLAPGMVFTVEPWYYNHDEQLSVFTEDIVLITEEGNEVLTNALPRTSQDLEKFMK